MEVILRDASPNLVDNFQIIPSDRVPMRMYWGARKTKPGFGVPVVLMSERCSGRPECKLLPPSGVARSATAWLEPGRARGTARLVLGHAIRTKGVYTGSNYWPLAEDSSAFYAAALDDSPIRRLSIWNLLGGREMGRRAGVYLLEDYDPKKRTLVMIHGLGSSPVTWARLSNAVWADPELRASYQIWQVVYETNEPILVARHRVKQHLDAAWEVLDPSGTAPARHHMVLLGHSMGGAISRLLMAQSNDAVWNAAFTKPVASLAGSSEDIRYLEAMFRFDPYPGVRRGVFLASPHQGSPTAGSFIGRTFNRLVGRRSPELASLQRVAAANEEAIPLGLRDYFLRENINSITTLRRDQPVMAAARALTIPCATPFHTIAGHRANSSPPGDGIVPLDSAILPGAASTLVIEAGHNVHEYDEAIAEVVRILHLDLSGTAQASCGLMHDADTG
ncbi:alpha/beta hydrolase [Pseudoxanthomonas sp. SL93]|uniref:esterase/lipase family protein n=1 Tax=Pseudoxanthomonas sp. SL93 TaxID=2995142 RepID=UPI002270247D|nr:alpha/beta hydrolase [Pseudoxanthomonas sp. SL93]WAC64032.1 alpha/beta hydrolase [Pseudoxanthomonas sp. SL93]